MILVLLIYRTEYETVKINEWLRCEIQFTSHKLNCSTKICKTTVKFRNFSTNSMLPLDFHHMWSTIVIAERDDNRKTKIRGKWTCSRYNSENLKQQKLVRIPYPAMRNETRNPVLLNMPSHHFWVWFHTRAK